MFDSDARRAQGPVLFWIDRLLKAPAPLRMSSNRAAANTLKGAAACAAVARNGLFQLLRSNPDMFNVCVDRCYDPDPRVASCYFQVWPSSSNDNSRTTTAAAGTATAVGLCGTCGWHWW
jgi:hypothetical protein